MGRCAPVLLGAALLALAACTPREPTAPAAGDGLPDAGCGMPGEIREALLARVNAARGEARQCGDRRFGATQPLDWSRPLARAAADHAHAMAREDFVAHAGPDGRRVDARAEAAGYDWRAIGENVGAGARSVAQTVDHWLGSPEHCRNLMNPDYEDIGAACASAPGSRYTNYWVLVLGEPR